jgi:hypothetical protein
VRVHVVPLHDDLNDAVKIGQRQIGRHPDSSPDARRAATQFEF